MFARRACLRCVFAVLRLPCGVLCCPSSRCVNRAVSFVERRCNSGSLPLGCPSPPLGCPRAGSGRTARRGAVPSDSSRDDVAAPNYLACGGFDWRPLLGSRRCGSRRPPRAPRGPYGCATFLSLVSLSSKASLDWHRFFCLAVTAIRLGNREIAHFRVLVRCAKRHRLLASH